MQDWAEREAEKIVDAFLAYQGTGDLVMLQSKIIAAQNFPSEMGCLSNALDTPMAPIHLTRHPR